MSQADEVWRHLHCFWLDNSSPVQFSQILKLLFRQLFIPIFVFSFILIALLNHLGTKEDITWFLFDHNHISSTIMMVGNWNWFILFFVIHHCIQRYVISFNFYSRVSGFLVLVDDNPEYASLSRRENMTPELSYYTDYTFDEIHNMSNGLLEGNCNDDLIITFSFLLRRCNDPAHENAISLWVK
jgi:hypothetical protein